MTAKRAFLWSLATFFGMLLIGIVLVVLFVDTTGPGAQQRAKTLGSAMGFTAMIPSAIIWARWAVAFRQAKEQKSGSRGASKGPRKPGNRTPKPRRD